MWLFNEIDRCWEFVPTDNMRGLRIAPNTPGYWVTNQQGWRAFRPEVTVWSDSGSP